MARNGEGAAEAHHVLAIPTEIATDPTLDVGGADPQICGREKSMPLTSILASTNATMLHENVRDGDAGAGAWPGPGSNDCGVWISLDRGLDDISCKAAARMCLILRASTIAATWEARCSTTRSN
jgi:hypothetical protein